MKFWIKYVLPVVMAFCLFLGSSFFSLEACAAGESQDYPQMSVLPDDVKDGAHYIYLHSNSGSTYYFYYCNFVNNSDHDDFTHKVLSNGSSCILIPHDSVRYSYNAATDSWKFDSGVPYGVTMYLNSYSVYSANCDILDADTGEIFFRAPSPFQRVVRTQDWAAVMMEIIAILPLLILSLTSLLALRKGLKHILSFLRQA